MEYNHCNKGLQWPCGHNCTTFTKPIHRFWWEFDSAFYVSTLSTNEKSWHRAAAGRKWKKNHKKSSSNQLVSPFIISPWSWAKFMAAHIWDINFAVICELHHYSGYNNEPVCPKCSFKLILYNLTWYHVTFLWHNWDHWDNLSSPCRDLIEPCWHTVNSCFFGKIYGPNMSSHKSIPGP